jgi:ribosome-associated protein
MSKWHEKNDRDDQEELPPSRTEIKKEMQALQELGKTIVELSKGQLATIPLDDPTLAEAISTARRIKSREGLRRQMQFIGKLLRKLNVEPIQKAMQQLQEGRKEQALAFHQLEQWRDQVIENGPNQLDEVFERFPNADRQHLRQLILQANKEKKQDKPPAAARKLFRYFRELSTE